MLEYLFKGKRTDNGEWIEGAFYAYYDFKRTRVQILKDRTNGIPDAFEVIPETICQYTGKNDRKGTKIFECDRIRFFDEEGTSDYIIKWDDYECRFIIEDERGCTDGLNGFIAANCEVIGNVHDLPKDAVKEGAEK